MSTLNHNHLLASLGVEGRKRLSSSLEVVALERHQVLEGVGHQIEHIYFVETGMVSVVATTEPHHRIEVGMIGREGMTGLSVLLGDDRPVNETIVQSSGSAARMSSASLRKALKADPLFLALLLRYVNVFIVQGSQTALANGRGTLGERLARWLLMWQDRVGGDDLIVTHEFLALLLGVRRPGVTVALHLLEGAGLIRSTRSLIRVLNRPALRAASNGFYGIPEAEYERAIGLPRAVGHA